MQCVWSALHTRGCDLTRLYVCLWGPVDTLPNIFRYLQREIKDMDFRLTVMLPRNSGVMINRNYDNLARFTIFWFHISIFVRFLLTSITDSSLTKKMSKKTYFLFSDIRMKTFVK